MIYESEYWKDDLLKQAKVLRQRMLQKRWPAAASARLEQSIMLGFYSVRKLAEAKLLADSVVNQCVELRVYMPTGKAVTLINWHKLDELYDLNSGQSGSKDVMFLCHQFVHSYVFVASFDEQSHGLEGILFASDRERHKALYHIDIQKVIELFEKVGSDYPNEVHMKFNKQKRDYDVISTTRR